MKDINEIDEPEDETRTSGPQEPPALSRHSEPHVKFLCKLEVTNLLCVEVCMFVQAHRVQNPCASVLEVQCYRAIPLSECFLAKGMN